MFSMSNYTRKEDGNLPVLLKLNTVSVEINSILRTAAATRQIFNLSSRVPSSYHIEYDKSI